MVFLRAIVGGGLYEQVVNDVTIETTQGVEYGL